MDFLLPSTSPSKQLPSPDLLQLAPDRRYAAALKQLMSRSLGSDTTTVKPEEAVIRRLDATIPIVESIRRQFQSPSFSIGVVHRGQTVFTKGFGFADKGSLRVPDPQTIYSAGCCTKAFTATLLSLLDQAGRVNLEGLLSDNLPEIQECNPNFAAEDVELGDLLSHCTGLAAVPLALRGINGSVFAQPKDVLHIFANLPSVTGLRSEWYYNEWSYAAAAYLIDAASNHSRAQCLDDILGRLGLMRTYTNHTPDDNYARAYVVSGGSQSEDIYRPLIKGYETFGDSSSMQTCVSDMLRWCKLLIRSSKLKKPMKVARPRAIYPVSSNDLHTFTMEKILNALWNIQQPEFPLGPNPAPDLGQTYGLGLHSLTLPTKAINTLTNDSDVTESYMMGANSDTRHVIGDTGDLGSFTSAYWVFPDTDSAVVVLTNASSANGDPSNLISQILIQALFELKPTINYIKIAADIISNAKLQWMHTIDAWASHRMLGTRPQHLNAYVGDYTNSDLRMTLNVEDMHPDQPGKLRLWINGLREQRFELYHYHRDCWTFLPETRDECLRLGLAGYVPCWKSFVLDFGRSAGGICHAVKWKLDPDPRVGAHEFGRVVEDF